MELVHCGIYEAGSMESSLVHIIRADSRLPPSQTETSLQSNAISHWLGTYLESAQYNGPLPTQYPTII